MTFKFLEHTADIKFIVKASSIEKLFEQCVLAMASYMVEGRKIKFSATKNIKASAKKGDNEALLYAFLDELIFLVDAEGFVPSKAKVSIKSGKLEAKIYGDSTKEKHLNHIKSPTFAEMYVKKEISGWKAQVVLDV